MGFWSELFGEPKNDSNSNKTFDKKTNDLLESLYNHKSNDILLKYGEQIFFFEKDSCFFDRMHYSAKEIDFEKNYLSSTKFSMNITKDDNDFYKLSEIYYKNNKDFKLNLDDLKLLEMDEYVDNIKKLDLKTSDGRYIFTKIMYYFGDDIHKFKQNIVDNVNSIFGDYEIKCESTWDSSFSYRTRSSISTRSEQLYIFNMIDESFSPSYLTDLYYIHLTNPDVKLIKVDEDVLKKNEYIIINDQNKALEMKNEFNDNIINEIMTEYDYINSKITGEKLLPIESESDFNDFVKLKNSINFGLNEIKDHTEYLKYPLFKDRVKRKFTKE